MSFALSSVVSWSDKCAASITVAHYWFSNWIVLVSFVFVLFSLVLFLFFTCFQGHFLHAVSCEINNSKDFLRLFIYPDNMFL